MIAAADSTPMLAVSNADPERLRQIVEELAEGLEPSAQPSSHP